MTRPITLYTGQWADLPLAELAEKGLRNRKGRSLSLTGLLTILRNPFYAGMIRLRRRAHDERYPSSGIWLESAARL